MLRAGLRRFFAVAGITAAATAAISLLLGLLLGSSITRALSVGFYLVGSCLLVMAFFVGNRGPTRLKGEGAALLFGPRLLRWASRDEQEETLNTSAVLLALGFVLIVLGVVADTRESLA